MGFDLICKKPSSDERKCLEGECPEREDHHETLHMEHDNAIAALVDAVRSDQGKAMGARYSEQVYEAVWELVNATEALRAADMEKYQAEIERRRRIGLTIDPATAETTFWWADGGDPYGMLGPKYYIGCVGRERFARNPGGDWVEFGDLPKATSEALWKRDGRKLSFPYGLDPSDDVINYPPADKG
jgi:hypothetical protein